MERSVPPETTKKDHPVRRRMSNAIDEALLTRDSLAAAGPFVRASGRETDFLTNWIPIKFHRRSSISHDDDGEEERIAKEKVSFLALISFSTAREKWMMLAGLVAAAVSGCALPTWLVLLAKGLDRFSNLGYLINAGVALQDVVQDELNTLVIAFAVLGGVSLISGSLYVSLWTYTGEQQALRIMNQYITSAFHQDAEFFDANNRDELPTKIANSMVHIRGAIGRQIADLFANLWGSAGCLAVAFILNAPLALIMLCIVPIVVVIIAILACFIRKSTRQSSQDFSSAGALATEVISGIKTVAALCAEPWAIRKYNEHISSAQKSSVWSGFLAALSTGATGFLFYCTYTVAFFFGTYQVSENSSTLQFIVCIIEPWKFADQLPPWLGDIVGEIDPDQCRISGATVMCCIYGVVLCATFFGLMAPALQAINLGRQAAVDIFATIRRVPDINPASDKGIVLDKFQQQIEFSNIFFLYPTRPKNVIFSNFDLTVPVGSSVALVGPSGSGKSTVARLLLRFYDPTAGAVLVDGIPLSELNLKWWRSQIGYVPQEPFLFPGTIRDNIALGRLDATDEEVERAAKAACAHEFIKELPEGYDTLYSGASIQLSGGQLQRLSLARAMVRNPSILILDEATSALDTTSERQVQEAIENIRKHTSVTTVTIAHRLSTIVTSDKIAVISDGGIAEQGTHHELLVQGGIYASLCETQGITLDSKFEPIDTSERTNVSVKYSSIKKSMAKSVAGVEEGGVLNKEEEEKLAKQEELASVSRLWESNKPELGYLVMGSLGAIMVGGLLPCEGILTAQIVSNFYTQEPNDMLDANRPYILGFLALAGGSIIGNILSGCGFSVAGYRLTRRMRGQVFESIIRRDMGWFRLPGAFDR